MHPIRLLVLALGPVVLIGLAHQATSGRPSGVGIGASPEEATAAQARSASRDGFRGRVRPEGLADRHAGEPSFDVPPRSESRGRKKDSASPRGKAEAGVGQELRLACERKAASLRTRLSDRCELVIHPPFVIGGDRSREELSELYGRVIEPITAALAVYFEKRPDEPVTVLLFGSESRFQEHAERLDGQSRQNYYGYYRREDRRVMLNASTGSGTTAHELTHALAHFDFPELPEWLDEGLASLHEEAELTTDGSGLRGLPNWRVNHLLLGLRRGHLRTVEELMAGKAVRPGYEAIDYAQARYLCLFLQQRGQLIDYYRALRAARGNDSTGWKTLIELVQPQTAEEFDREFRTWAGTLRPVARRVPWGTVRM